MIILNLKANDEQQEVIKAYLEENASEELAKKINNGVEITKDGKTLISRKDLDGFMEYACKTAQEQSAKGSRSAMVKDDIVFGWAIHYFEEDTIEGTLYNPDGSKYEKPKPLQKSTPKTTPINAPMVKKNEQPTFFDLLSKQEEKTPVTETEQDDDEEITEEEKQEAFAELEKEEPKNVSPLYSHYLEVQRKYPDCVVAYRLGDFYEIFGDNAVKISNSLDLTLTGRDVGLPERIPMVGFPYHVADRYFQKIIDKGNKVAIVEGLNDVKLLQNEMKIDTETGEIVKPENNDLINVLIEIFGNDMEIKL